MTDLDPLELITPRRRIHGITAVLLPYDEAGSVDWESFEGLLRRTAAAGLTPAVNMDTGYANLLDEATRLAVLERTRDVLSGGPFVAGAFVSDDPAAEFAADAYAEQVDNIQSRGGTPIVFQSYGLAHRGEEAAIEAYRRIATRCDAFIAFELGEMFAPFGKIYSLDAYAALMAIPQCVGAKHSSLRREPEWRRLALRNAERPDFKVYTGNDLAIDMVIYGSDYLLGLSSFAPDAFAERDRLWEAGDPGWNEWNDLLQHLGFLAFRDPVPAYKHSAAMFLQRRGWITSSAPHPKAQRRGETDRELLAQVAERLDAMMTERESV